ncbi:DUF4274 domain-containing protein [Chryseobacterium tructae]|uniref:DUF4274 domain-containing protein n=1 Tax=Chryseobacterium tructae TaxID=1037380 RepID=UPI0025B519F7|nr:DUF4274 domain-containing protein [Chryseobacterium tructae]MDN3694983.1 DUF4274 domain-containing protein [Chryseobacterium tructae]
MNPLVHQIIYEEETLNTRLKLLHKIEDPLLLWELMSHYNWDDGFVIPLEVVKHNQCDLGLAMMLFWEFEEAKMYYEDPASIVSNYDNTEESTYKSQYCKTLINGIRKGLYLSGVNKYDTGFLGEKMPIEDERKQKMRALKTKRALETYESVFLSPVF